MPPHQPAVALLDTQRIERRDVRAVVAPLPIPFVPVEVARAASLDRALPAHALQVAQHLRLRAGDLLGAQADRGHAPPEQVGRTAHLLTPATKIVVVSGGAQFSKRNYLPDAELIGVEGTLQKPFDVDTLLGLLNRL